MVRAMVLFALILSFVGLSGVAQAYPGTAISAGSNPVRSVAGIRNLGDGFTVPDIISAPSDQDLILTDVFLGCAVLHDGQYYSGYVTLVGSDDVIYGAYTLQTSRLYDGGAPSTHNLAGTTGLRIPAGVSVSLVWTFTYQNYADNTHTMTYILGGYLAQS